MVSALVKSICLVVAILIAVAYLTIVERKVMGSIQRRLGPNAVGHNHKTCYFSAEKRHIHTTTYNKATEDLYINRKAPVIPFKGMAVDKCLDITSPKIVNAFFKNLKGKSGIYMFCLKQNPNIFYIGRAKDFQKRFKSHLNTSLNDRFHVFAKRIGWNGFNYSIIEICEMEMQKERENFYLQKYLPLLNTIFKSNLNTVQSYKSLYEILKIKQKEEIFSSKYQGIKLYTYPYVDDKIKVEYLKYNSIRSLSSFLNVGRDTIRLYLNTYVPYNNNLILTTKIGLTDFVEVEKLVSDAVVGLTLNNKATKVYLYSAEKDGTMSLKTSFKSKSAAAIYLNKGHGVINYHIDKWVKGGIDGNYVFTFILNKELLKKLKTLSAKPRTNNRKVWVYDSSTLELTTDSPFSTIQKAASYFGVDYRTIARYLDKEISTIKGGSYVVMFSREITKNEIALFNAKPIKKAINITKPLWVYKNLNGYLVKSGSASPSYKSILEASKILKITSKTINKYLDTTEAYQNLYFYSSFIQ